MRITNKFKTQLYNYFTKKLGAYQYKHGWLRVPKCPYCGREEKLGINLSTYRTNCFRCGVHPTPDQLVMDLENFNTLPELVNYLNSGNFEEYTFKEEKIELPEIKPVYLPEGYQNIKYGDSTLANTIRGYIKSRGFDIDFCSKHGIGYCKQGPLFGYLIIPFYYKGELRYYNARSVIGNGPRYNNPNKDITGVGKEFIIFNHDALYMYNSIYLCEGAINALTMGDRGIATMGKAVSRYQINEFIKSPVNRFIILLDPDAKEYAINLALKLVHYKKVKVVFLPDDKDCNDLGRKEVFKLVLKTHYQSYQELIKIKNSLV